MSKELEAFNELLDIICNQKQDNNLQNYINIIETALKALEIIKEKGVCLPALKLSVSFEEDNLEEYNAMAVKYYCLPYTQEVYDLLKDVLL